MSLRVGIDVSPLSDMSLTGIPLYVESLLRFYLRPDTDKANQFVLVGTPPRTDLNALLHARGIEMSKAESVPARDFRLGTRFSRLPHAARGITSKLDGRILLPLGFGATGKQVRGRNLDVFHHTALLRVPRKSARRHVVTIYDLTPRFYPETHNRVNRLEAERLFRWAHEYAALVITDSESARRDVITHLHIEPERVSAIPLGVRAFPLVAPGDRQATREKFGLLEKRFVLAVGSLEPRKNLPRLVEAFARFAREPGLTDVQLVLVGAFLHGAHAVETAIQQAGLAGRVQLTGYVTDKELAALMQTCDVFAYPSLYEGFGLPVAEALAQGAPVVTSSTSSLPEVAGDAALLADPQDIDALARAVRRILTDTDLANALRRRGPIQAARFSWETCARAHLLAYQHTADL